MKDVSPSSIEEDIYFVHHSVTPRDQAPSSIASKTASFNKNKGGNVGGG
jgi:hypothetical protein